jgi:bacteriorhodopsin
MFNSENIVNKTAYYSLGFQFLTGIIDVWGLQIKVPKDKEIFRDLLKVELGVQSVEFVFYSWMVYNFDKIENITPYRYLDWVITTPTMLVTLMAYLDENKKGSLIDYIKENKEIIIRVVSLNLVMLVLGLLGELNKIDYNFAILAGFIPFVYYFKIIYDKFITKDTPKDKLYLFYFFLIVWSLYGVVAFLPYNEKNASYNILDLFSKNLFGIFLVYILWTNRIK